MLRTIIALALAASAAPVLADTIPEHPDPAPLAARIDPSRPHYHGRAIYWSNHALVGLCGEFGGSFAKLPGSAVYVCTDLASVSLAATEER